MSSSRKGKKPPPDPKLEALRRRGCLHPHPEAVTDPAFAASDFFDARDVVQVKYEMLRRAADGDSVLASAAGFGFSRPSFYEARASFERDGLPGLMPKKRGPRSAHKLSAAVVAYLEELLATDSSLRTRELAARVRARFDLEVHPRSVERALARAKKKPEPAPPPRHPPTTSPRRTKRSVGT